MFDDLYPAADEALDAAIAEIASDVRAGRRAPVPVAGRDGAALVVRSSLVHIDSVGAETDLDGIVDDHRTRGDLGSIVVGDHEWRWQEIADGLRRALTPEENTELIDELTVEEVLLS